MSDFTQGPGRPAVGSFPFPHRTMAQVRADQARPVPPPSRKTVTVEQRYARWLSEGLDHAAMLQRAGYQVRPGTRFMRATVIELLSERIGGAA